MVQKRPTKMQSRRKKENYEKKKEPTATAYFWHTKKTPFSLELSAS